MNLELGMLPEISPPIGYDVKVHQEMIDFSARLYPFKGAFFVGCGVGAQRLTVKATDTQNGYTGDGNVVVNTLFVSPRLGFVHKFSFGLAVGMDGGVELPISGGVDASVNVAGFSIAPPREALDVANKVKVTPIPIVHLLQLGYIF